MPKISIIIPIYNTGPYLRRCLDSVTQQTLKDIEIICINDGSTDDCSHILDEYAQNDTRITVITFPHNQGVSRARNAGLVSARGEFIGFVDSDDYIETHFYEALYAAAKESGADIAKGLRYDEWEDRKNTDAEHEKQISSQIEYKGKISEKKYCFSINFTTAIYKKTIILENSIFFPENVANLEDVLFLVKAVYHANTVHTVATATYYRLLRGDSTSQATGKEKRLKIVASGCETILAFINSVAIDEHHYNHIFEQMLSNLFYSIKQGGESPEHFETLFTFLSRYKYLAKNELGDLENYKWRDSPARFFKSLKFVYTISRKGNDRTLVIKRLYRLCVAPTVCLHFGSLAPGGAERQAVALAKALSANGINVFILCTYLKGRYGHYLPQLSDSAVVALELAHKDFLAAGAALARKNTPLFNELKKLNLRRVALLNLAGGLSILMPDILHCYLDGGNCRGGPAGLLAGVPGIVLSCRSLDPVTAGHDHAEWDHPIYQYLLQQPNVAIEANSKQGAQAYAGWLDIQTDRIAVNHNGIDITAYGTSAREQRLGLRHSLGLQEATPVVFYLGRNHACKRPDDMLAIAALLRKTLPDARILAAGVGLGPNEAIETIARERDLCGTVLFLGTRNDIPALLFASDCLLLTSGIEAFPNSIMEAMCAALPVVATDIGGVPELVRDGVDGFLHSVGDIQGMTNSLLQLLGNAELRQKMGRQGRERIQKHFTVDKLLERTTQRYTSISPYSCWDIAARLP